VIVDRLAKGHWAFYRSFDVRPEPAPALCAGSLMRAAIATSPSLNVARRTREIAVRMALGARSGSVQWLVMRELLTRAGVGVAIALPAAWVLARLVQTQLYGVKAGDAGSIWMTVAALMAVALLAGYLPVRRAAGIEPIQALRSE